MRPPRASEPPPQEFAVYLNRADSRRTLLLSYPHKSSGRSGGYLRRPLRLRLKPTAGLVEVDLPIHSELHYDGRRAAQFAKALRTSRAARPNADHGLAGGFGANAPAPMSAAASAAAATAAAGGAQEEEEGLKLLTLGGRVQALSEHDASYMIGVFKEGELHLTPVDAVCSLRPQFHHLDALTDNERTSSSRGGAGDYAAQEPEARAVNMSVKSTEDEEIDMGEVGRTLRAIQEEAWQQLEFVDEDDAGSFAVFDSDLQLHDGETKQRRLVSALTELQYREVAGAPRIEPMNQGRRVLSARPWPDDDEAVDEGEAVDLESKPVPAPAAGKRKAPAVKVEVEGS